MANIDRETLFELNHKFENAQRQIDVSGMSERNKSMIREFLTFCTAEGISKHRHLFYTSRLLAICSMTDKDLDKCNRQDIERIMEKVNERNYSAYTIIGFQVTLKKFYRYLYKCSKTDSAPDLVKWMVRKNPENELRAQDLYTEEDVKRVIRSCMNDRDKCFIAMIYECALRPSEARSITFGDITPTEYGYKVIVKGKTGAGTVYVNVFRDLLSKWMNSHPKPDHTAPLFCMYRNTLKVMSHAYAHKLFTVACRKASIKGKPSNLYILRHSKLTEWTSQGMAEAIIRKLARHKPSSKALAVYQHLTDADAENQVLINNGTKAEPERKHQQGLKVCPNCKNENSPTFVVCSKCGSDLNPMENIMRKDISIEDVQRIFREELNKLIAEGVIKKTGATG